MSSSCAGDSLGRAADPAFSALSRPCPGLRAWPHGPVPRLSSPPGLSRSVCPCPHCWPFYHRPFRAMSRLPLLHRLVQVCCRVAMNATVIQRFEFDIILVGLFHHIIYPLVSAHVNWESGTCVFKQLYMGVDLNSFIRDPSFSPKKNYFRQTFAFLRFIFRRSTLYLCVPCMLCFVHVNGFFFTGKHKIEISLFVSMCLLLNC